MRTETSLCLNTCGSDHIQLRHGAPLDTADVLEGTDPEKAKEWNELEITFTWEAGEAALNPGTVTVSYHPVTDDVSKTMRYASGPTNPVIDIEDCITNCCSRS